MTQAATAAIFYGLLTLLCAVGTGIGVYLELDAISLPCVVLAVGAFPPFMIALFQSLER